MKLPHVAFKSLLFERRDGRGRFSLRLRSGEEVQETGGVTEDDAFVVFKLILPPSEEDMP